MGCIKNDETRNDEKKIDATATVRQGEGDGAVGNLEAIRCDARGMKGDDRNSREKPEDLDMDKHQVSLARGELRSNRNPGIAAKPRGAVASEFPWCVGDLRGPSYLLNGHFWRKAVIQLEIAWHLRQGGAYGNGMRTRAITNSGPQPSTADLLEGPVPALSGL